MRRRRLVVGTQFGLAALVIGGFAVTGVAAAASATDRYASPDGSGVQCTTKHPCSVVTAINDAPTGAKVVVERGHYGSARHPLTTVLQPGTGPIKIRGSIAHPPTIYSAASNGLVTTSSTIRGVVMRYSGVGTGLIGNAIDHVRVFNAEPNGNACTLSTTVTTVVTNTLCVATGQEGAGILVDGGNPAMPFTLHYAMTNVTAIGRGAGGFGTLLLAGQYVTLDLSATNTLFDGALADVAMETTDASAGIEVRTNHCRVKVEATLSDAVGSVTATGSHDIKAAPKFVEPAAGNFAERAKSATVDAGRKVDDAKDVAGNKRSLGKRPDIGAYEYVPPRHHVR